MWRVIVVDRQLLLFIVLDVDDDDVQRILSVVDHTADRDAGPLIYFVQSDSTLSPGAAPQRKYRLDTGSSMTTAIITQFIHDVLDGKIKVSRPRELYTGQLDDDDDGWMDGWMDG